MTLRFQTESLKVTINLAVTVSNLKLPSGSILLVNY